MKLSKGSSVLILSHFNERSDNAEFPPQLVRDYLQGKIKTIVYIEHAFPYSKDHRSSMTIYENGILKKHIFSPQIFGPEALFYILDIFITFYFLIIARVHFDLCIALDNLNTLSVLPFKKAKLVKKLVFYTIDYTPFRFKNKILNSIYHFIDRIACYNADAIWVVSPRMISARKNNGVNSKKTAPSISLPIGANLSRIKIIPIEKINRSDIVFVGHLLEKQGVQLVLESLPKIISKIPDLRFIVIGQGEYEQTLKDLTISLNIGNHVIFKGFVDNHRDVENILCKSAVGLAPYVPTPDNFTVYADPGKIKLYVACGLPVVVTDVPAIAHVIKSQKAGLVIDYTTNSFVKALTKLLSDDALHKTYRENAIKLSMDYDTSSLIEKALVKL